MGDASANPNLPVAPPVRSEVKTSGRSQTRLEQIHAVQQAIVPFYCSTFCIAHGCASLKSLGAADCQALAGHPGWRLLPPPAADILARPDKRSQLQEIIYNNIGSCQFSYLDASAWVPNATKPALGPFRQYACGNTATHERTTSAATALALV